LGAGPLRAALTVDLPRLWRPLLAATGFAFAVSLGEFGATSFLSRPDRPTLPVAIYQLVSRPGEQNLGMALAASVVLALLTVSVMALVERLRLGSVGAF
jgi:thiamine transport system permease protein